MNMPSGDFAEKYMDRFVSMVRAIASNQRITITDVDGWIHVCLVVDNASKALFDDGVREGLARQFRRMSETTNLIVLPQDPTDEQIATSRLKAQQ